MDGELKVAIEAMLEGKARMQEEVRALALVIARSARLHDSPAQAVTPPPACE